MTLRITCPGCKTALKLGDDMRGHKVRCTNCDKGLNIPAANGRSRAADEEERVSRKPHVKPARARAEEEEEEQEEERPAKKKKKKKKQGAPLGLLVGIGVGVLLLLIVGGVGATAYYLRDNGAKPAPPAPVAQNKDGNNDAKGAQANGGQPGEWVPPQRIVVPGIKEGNPANQKVGGKSITGNMRGQIYRTERRSELKQIGTLYIAYCDDVKNKNLRTQDDFLKSIERDARSLAAVIREGYYVMNMKADLNGASIIAYERDIDTAGYLCVRGSGEVDYVPEQEWKTALGK